MKVSYLVLAGLLTFPAAAQTANDDTPSIENWWDNVGSGFFSDATLLTPRPEYEIRAHWTGLSDDDRAAVLSRCAALQGQTAPPPVSKQEGDKDEDPNATPAELADGALLNDMTQAADDQTAAVQNDGTPVPKTQNDRTTVTGSVSGTEVQSPSPLETPEPNTGLAGVVTASDNVRTIRVCDLVKKL